MRGAELRAISAIDVALWDILGQVCKQPIYRLLGGPVRDRVPVYNSCGNPSYGRNPGGDPGWPGYGTHRQAGAVAGFLQRCSIRRCELAEELLAEGYTAMKVWPFDGAAHRNGGMRISLADLEEAVRPLREIRKRVGSKIELMVDGHGFFMLPAALRIADALREIQPLWLEDILKMDNIDTLADFRRQSRMPISASEMLLSRADYAQVLAQQGRRLRHDRSDLGRRDFRNGPAGATWRRRTTFPSTMHDCTGPADADCRACTSTPPSRDAAFRRRCGRMFDRSIRS